MKKHILIITALLMIMSVFVITGCGSANDAEEETAATEDVQTEDVQTEEKEAAPETGGSDTLVVYFSATGNTRGVAEKIAAVTGADIYEIKAAQPYTDEDLDYNDKNSRTTHEQNDKSARPEIGGDPVSLEGYSKVYIGYPIWWGEEPRIMDTFVESNDFDGITMIPFCTSGGSGIGSSGKNLADNAESGSWLGGDRLDTGISEDELKAWISEISGE